MSEHFELFLVSVVMGAAGAFVGMWVVDRAMARKRRREDAALIRGMLSSLKKPPTDPKP